MLSHSQRPSAVSLVEANAAIPSHLHPVALRSTTLASSPRIAAASLLAEAQLRASQPASSSPPTPLPSPPTSLPLDASADSDNGSSTSDSATSARPRSLAPDVAALSIDCPSNPGQRKTSEIAGLQIDPSRYPTLSSLQTPQASRPQPASSSSANIRLITCAEYVEIYDAYLSSASLVDESVVFPWLHCSDLPGTLQANYFADSPNAKSPPRYRGLTVVSADPDLGPRSITRSNPDSRRAPPPAPSTSYAHKTHDRSRTRSLGGSSTKSSNSVDSSATGSSGSHFTAADSVATTPTSPSTSVVSFDGPEPRASLLCSSLLGHDFLERCPHTGQFTGSFALPRLPGTVNLRLFRQQAARYATVSDIVVYSETGMSDEALGLAQLVRAAQDECFRNRGGNAGGAIEYNVYVVSEPFEVFERSFNRVVAVDGWGYRRNKIDFFEREREEMATLTKASEIATNVWLGNSADVPLAREDQTASRKRSLASDQSSPITSQQPVKTDEHGNLPYDICIEAHDQAMITSSLQFHLNQSYLDRLRQGVTGDVEASANEIVHMEVASTGQSCSGPASRDKLVRYLVDLCVWVKRIANPIDRPGQPGRKVLLHCHDGYTETSLFALSYVMFDRGCSLPEAYLFLQTEKGRSFFVYPADVQLLRRVESRIEQELQEQRRASMHRLALEEPSRSSFLRARVPFGLASTMSSKGGQPSAPAPPTPRPTRAQHAWFYDSRFDGHFPSRILPFVYLGNLNHASNALMLKALGITHVVSMGESALVPPGPGARQPVVSLPNGSQASVVNSLWHEYASGQIDVLDMKGVADDGIDSIRPHIERAMGFIEQCRLAGGKVLVHCRVGVSRSATIVIGYVMKYLAMDLASAYLMVRSRRLNILIQPNLLFMWGLRRLESDLVQQDEEARDDARQVGEGGLMVGGVVSSRRVRMMGWSYLAREIAELNHRYLC